MSQLYNFRGGAFEKCPSTRDNLSCHAKTIRPSTRLQIHLSKSSSKKAKRAKEDTILKDFDPISSKGTFLLPNRSRETFLTGVGTRFLKTESRKCESSSTKQTDSKPFFSKGELREFSEIRRTGSHSCFSKSDLKETRSSTSDKRPTESKKLTRKQRKNTIIADASYKWNLSKGKKANDNKLNTFETTCNVFDEFSALFEEYLISNFDDFCNLSEELTHYSVPTCMGRKDLFCYPREYQELKKKIIGKSNQEAAACRPENDVPIGQSNSIKRVNKKSQKYKKRMTKKRAKDGYLETIPEE